MLPYIPPEKQCTAKAKSTQQRCLNPAAYGCKTCRLHGARKPESIRRGANHPQYKDGLHTKEALADRHQASFRLHHIASIGNALGIFNNPVRLRGRKPK